MFSNSQADYLVKLSKRLERGGIILDNYTINQQFPFQHEFNLISPDDPEYVFLYEVNQSAKNQFKMTLYFMENDAKIGLLRIDFNGQHENPQNISENVPSYLTPFAGK